MIRLRVATYNVHKCRGMDWRISPARVLAVIQEFNADIFALQEIFAGQVVYFSGRLAMPHVFGPARQLGKHAYGNAIFSRYPILQSRNYDLSIGRREPRRCLRADVQVAPGRSIHLFAAHLGTSFFERRQQAARLVSKEVLEESEWKGPRILVGDFNEWTRGRVTRMLSAHMQSADLAAHLGRSRTYPGMVPFLHLDHIYYDPPLNLIAMHFDRNSRALIASDHLPLIGEFEWSG